jgi:hypothetical protein
MRVDEWRVSRTEGAAWLVSYSFYLHAAASLAAGFRKKGDDLKRILDSTGQTG